MSELRPSAVVLAASLLLPVLSSAAEEPAGFPSRPVRLIVPFPAGGGTDLIARLVAQKLAEAWGQPVIVDNRPGAGSVIGSEIVARSTPDGPTLLLTANPHTSNPALYRKLPYDTVRDVAAVTQIASAPLMVQTESV